MNFTEVPWLEVGLLLAVLGAAWSAFARPSAVVGVVVSGGNTTAVDFS